MLEVIMKPTPSGYVYPDGTRHAIAKFYVEGSPAQAVYEADHTNFYGALGSTREAAQARRAIYSAVNQYLDDAFPRYTAVHLLRAESEDTDGEPTPYRARIVVEVDYL